MAHRRLAVGLTAGAALWVLALLLAPLALSSGRTAAAGGAILYAGASRICHQKPERSFRLGGIPLPVCARCLALYAGGTIGALLGWVGARRLPSGGRTLLGAAAVPVAASVGLEWLGAAAPSNAARFAVSAPLGVAAGWTFVRRLLADADAL